MSVSEGVVSASWNAPGDEMKTPTETATPSDTLPALSPDPSLDEVLQCLGIVINLPNTDRMTRDHVIATVASMLKAFEHPEHALCVDLVRRAADEVSRAEHLKNMLGGTSMLRDLGEYYRVDTLRNLVVAHNERPFELAKELGVVAHNEVLKEAWDAAVRGPTRRADGGVVRGVQGAGAHAGSLTISYIGLPRMENRNVESEPIKNLWNPTPPQMPEFGPQERPATPPRTE